MTTITSPCHGNYCSLVLSNIDRLLFKVVRLSFSIIICIDITDIDQSLGSFQWLYWLSVTNLSHSKLSIFWHLTSRYIVVDQMIDMEVNKSRDACNVYILIDKLHNCIIFYNCNAIDYDAINYTRAVRAWCANRNCSGYSLFTCLAVAW